MDHIDHLKHLKKIKPRADYVLRSRAEILTRVRPFHRPSLKEMFVGAFQSGSAMALVAVLLVFLGGGFSLMKIIETAGGLDSQSLRAEAQAIDIQINLADLSYNNFTENTPRSISIKKAAPRVAPKATADPDKTSSTSTPSNEATSTPAAPEPLTIDEVLDALSK